MLFEDNFNKTGPPCCDNIDPATGDAPGRQSGSAAPLDYLEDLDHEDPGGGRNNMTQVNNPDYLNALLLAPSNDLGFEVGVFAQPDHDFSDDPGPGNRTVIEVDINPVHDSTGIQVTSSAAATLHFAIGRLSLYDHGGWDFSSGPATASGDLDPLDAGGLGGSFAGFHNVRVELTTDAYVHGNPLTMRVLVDGSPLAIDTDGSPDILESAVPILGAGLAVKLEGVTDASAPGKVSGFTAFTLHGFDNLRIAIEPVPDPSADFDEDGDKDGVDFLAWQLGFGITSGASKAQGDADNNGTVDAADLAVWELQYDTPALVAGAAVPEPAAATLALAALCLAMSRRRIAAR